MTEKQKRSLELEIQATALVCGITTDEAWARYHAGVKRGIRGELIHDYLIDATNFRRWNDRKIRFNAFSERFELADTRYAADGWLDADGAANIAPERNLFDAYAALVPVVATAKKLALLKKYGPEIADYGCRKNPELKAAHNAMRNLYERFKDRHAGAVLSLADFAAVFYNGVQAGAF